MSGFSKVFHNSDEKLTHSHINALWIYNSKFVLKK
jgi:hypothetical protein